MTAGNLHFGLYRNPPVWRISDVSLDTLTFLDESMFTDEVSETHNKEATKTKEDGTKNDQKRKTKILQRKRLMTESEENHICCCRIS
ncbi:hypothetical protein BY458DRAFT_444441 [Sporodiniella umbellata]|nr:hypothetical protein BY458DRAFT_444441 [Sporodiniella umbellata]